LPFAKFGADRRYSLENIRKKPKLVSPVYDFFECFNFGHLCAKIGAPSHPPGPHLEGVRRGANCGGGFPPLPSKFLPSFVQIGRIV
jgi:hypothetical protein